MRVATYLRSTTVTDGLSTCMVLCMAAVRGWPVRVGGWARTYYMYVYVVGISARCDFVGGVGHTKVFFERPRVRCT